MSFSYFSESFPHVRHIVVEKNVRLNFDLESHQLKLKIWIQCEEGKVKNTKRARNETLERGSLAECTRAHHLHFAGFFFHTSLPAADRPSWKFFPLPPSSHYRLPPNRPRNHSQLLSSFLSLFRLYAFLAVYAFLLAQPLLHYSEKCNFACAEKNVAAETQSRILRERDSWHQYALPN